MAKIRVMGNVLQLKSEVTKEVYERVKSFIPNLFTVVDPQTGEELFKITYVEDGAGTISPYGIVFDELDSEGHIYITVPHLIESNSPRAIKDKLVEKYSKPLAHLQAIEDEVRDNADRIRDIYNRTETIIEFI